jgi:hypothetical protein
MILSIFSLVFQRLFLPRLLTYTGPVIFLRHSFHFSLCSLLVQRENSNLYPYILICFCVQFDLLCGLVVRLPSSRLRDPGFDSCRYQIF